MQVPVACFLAPIELPATWSAHAWLQECAAAGCCAPPESYSMPPAALPLAHHRAAALPVRQLRHSHATRPYGNASHFATQTRTQNSRQVYSHAGATRSFSPYSNSSSRYVLIAANNVRQRSTFSGALVLWLHSHLHRRRLHD